MLSAVRATGTVQTVQGRSARAPAVACWRSATVSGMRKDKVMIQTRVDLFVSLFRAAYLMCYTGRRAEVKQQFADGGVGDTAERRRNRERGKAQLAQLDAGLAPVAELLGRLKGVDPPDYGSFDVRSAVVPTSTFCTQNGHLQLRA